MIELTKISGDVILINPEMIQSVEKAGDTVVTLSPGKERLLVKNQPQDIASAFIAYKQRCSGALPSGLEGPSSSNSNQSSEVL